MEYLSRVIILSPVIIGFAILGVYLFRNAEDIRERRLSYYEEHPDLARFSLNYYSLKKPSGAWRIRLMGVLAMIVALGMLLGAGNDLRW